MRDIILQKIGFDISYGLLWKKTVQRKYQDRFFLKKKKKKENEKENIQDV